MFRHVVLLSIDPDAGSTAVDDIIERLRTLPSRIPELRSYQVGRDVGLADDNATVAVVADFDDVDGFIAYRDHPAHRAVISEYIRPVLVGRTAVQHHVEPAGTDPS